MLKAPNFVRLADQYRREEDFNQELATNLALLGIGGGFEEAETEARVGTRRADIVAKGDDGILVIECQFGKADWDHWGRLEAYARLKDAATAVLVAEAFEELMVVTCDMRNRDSEISWYLITALMTDRKEIIFQHASGPKIAIQTESAGREISEFWAPIRASGFFSGKPVPVKDEGWISKSYRGVQIILYAYKQSTKVEAVWPIDRVEERDGYAKKAAHLNPNLRETPRSAFLEFPYSSAA